MLLHSPLLLLLALLDHNFDRIHGVEVYKCSHGQPSLRNGQVLTVTADETCPQNFLRRRVQATFICCPMPWLEYDCDTLQPSPGTRCEVDGGIRFFYNRAVKSCQGFYHAGCGGNANIFFSKQQCDNYCSHGVRVPAGKAVVVPAAPNNPFVCKNDEPAYMVGIHPLYCNPLAPQCYPGQKCLESKTTAGKHMCCRYAAIARKAEVVYCKNDAAAYMLGTVPMYCNPNSVSWQCPQQYSCLETKSSANVFVCCNTVAENPTQPACLNDAKPYMMGKTPLYCNPQSTTWHCPVGYACTAPKSGVGNHMCCTINVTPPSNTLSNCTNGALAYKVGNTPMYCNPGSTSWNCPIGYACTEAWNVPGKHFCCGSRAPEDEPVRCPANKTPLKIGNSLRFCAQATVTASVSTFAVSNRCPSDYKCDGALDKAGNSLGFGICCSWVADRQWDLNGSSTSDGAFTAGFILPGNKCGAEVGSTKCTGGSTCLNGRCMCPRGQIARARKCQFPNSTEELLWNSGHPYYNYKYY